MACKIKNLARKIGIKEILWSNGKLRISPIDLVAVPHDLVKKYPNLNYKPATRLLVIPYTTFKFNSESKTEFNIKSHTEFHTESNTESDTELLNWINSLISSLTTLVQSE